MEERAGRPRVPRLPPESPASFYRKGAGHVPGRPFVPGPRLRLPAECLRYSSLLLLVYWLVARSSTPERATVIVNMPELEGDLRRSERWIRRGFHTLAAYGLLYSIPTVEEDGVDRRRYRFRLLARAGVDITSADRDAALADLADSESEETEEFPDGVPWLRTNGASGSSDPAPSDAAPASPMAGRTLSPAAALDNREEGSGSPDGAASPPTPAAAAGVGTAEDGTTSEELALAHAVLAAPIPHDIRDKLVAIGRKTGYRLRGRHPRWAEASSKLVETTMAAIRHRYGEVRPVLVVKAEHGEKPLLIERADDAREREAARCAIVHRLGPEADLTPADVAVQDVKKHLPDFVLPSDPDFKPGRSGWRYAGGCWHGPRSVCACFVEGVIRDQLSQLIRGGPSPAPATG